MWRKKCSINGGPKFMTIFILYYIFICHTRSILYIINEIIVIKNRNQDKSVCTKEVQKSLNSVIVQKWNVHLTF